MDGIQGRRSWSACELHPQPHEGKEGGFCPSCLRDRLNSIDQAQGQGRADAHLRLRRCSSFSARSHSHFHSHADSSFTLPEMRLRPRLRAREDQEEEEEQSPKPIKTHLEQSHSQSHSHSRSNFFLRKWHQWRSSSSSSSSKPRKQQPQPPQQCQWRSSSVDYNYHCPPRFSFDSSLLSHSHHPRFSFQDQDHNYNQIPLPLPLPLQDDHQDDDPNQDQNQIPGSQIQTRNYYLDSSTSARHRNHRKSFERSSSNSISISTRQPPDLAAFNSKVSPAAPAEFYRYHPPPPQPLYPTHSLPPHTKKKWSLWGLIHRKGNPKDQSPNAALPPNHFVRCNSTVSARSSFSTTSSYNNANANAARRNSVDINAYTIKRKDDFLLQRNRSARFSPDQQGLDNTLLRFHLTGSHSGRRSTGARPVSTASQSLSMRHLR